MLFDTRYNFVGKTSEENLFIDNSIDNLVKSLPLYSQYFNSKEYDYNLYARQYVPWNTSNEECSYNSQIALPLQVQEYEDYLVERSDLLYHMGIGG